MMRNLLIGLLAFLLAAPAAHAQSTKAQLNTEITATFIDNTVGAITPAGLRAVTSDVVNSIMPTAPVVANNTVCFEGTTGLLKDCGIPPSTLIVGTSVISSGVSNGLLYNNGGILANTAAANGGLLNTSNVGVPAITPNPVLGVAGSAVGSIAFANGTSGSITLQPATGALGGSSAAFPAGVYNVVGDSLTQTLASKTLTSPILTTPALGVSTGTSLALNGATIGSNVLAVNGTTQLVGATTVTAASASSLTVGLNGAANPAFQVDASTASQATGLKVTGAAAGGGVAVASISSGSNENLVFNALGTGQLIFGNVSTGAITLTRATTMSAALTYGGVTLNNAVTGTGNMVLSSAPTLTLTNATGLPLATGVTGNLPVANAPIVSAFSVHKNGTDQTGITSATLTLVTWGTELYDIGNNFASNAWTPPSGKVHLNATVAFSGTITAGANCQVVINKNGAAFLQSGVNPSTNLGSITISTDDVANGTDAYTVVVFITTSAGTATVTGAAINSRFSGHWVSP